MSYLASPSSLLDASLNKSKLILLSVKTFLKLKLESIWRFGLDPGHESQMIMSWDLTEVDGGTKVTVTAENVPESISEQDHAAGLASSLEKLALFLNA